MADDYDVALRRFLALVDPHLKPIHWKVDPKAGLTLAEAVLHFASEADAERHKGLALAWGDPPPTRWTVWRAWCGALGEATSTRWSTGSRATFSPGSPPASSWPPGLISRTACLRPGSACQPTAGAS